MTAVWSSHLASVDGPSRVLALEDVAIHVIREAYGQFERPALQLFEAAASRALLRVAEKAFWPARVPFDVVAPDAPTEHFDAVLSAPDGEWGHRVTSGIFAVHDGSVLDSVSDQRRDLWDLYNGRRRVGEQVRIVPLSSWTSHDVWTYLAHEGLDTRESAAG